MANKIKEEFEGVVSRNQDGAIVVDLSSMSSSETVTIITGNSVQLRAPVPEQTNEIGVIESKVDTRALKIGDVLCTDLSVLPDRIQNIEDIEDHIFIIPESLKRLNGWQLYNFKEDGTPQFMEPKESAPEGVVNWKTGMEHAEVTLKKQGHQNARLWTEADGDAICKNIVNGGHNHIARLDIYGSGPLGSWWESTEDGSYPAEAVVRYLVDGSGRNRRLEYKGYLARVRAVQDVPELSPYVQELSR
jgi:hypothetical protein